ncbi:MAG: SDR family oxidoreductase [Pseudomonadota bacterium]
MSGRTIVVVGANRGIGLEFVRQYLAAGERVVAACRDPSAATDLSALAVAGALVVHPCDVADEASVAGFAKAVGDAPIDILVNNAGVDGRAAATFDALDYAAFVRCLNVNTVGPVRTIAALRANLRRSDGARVANISSNLGGIAEAGGGHYAYRASKAALNMLTKAIAEDFRGDDVIVAAFHPGWVKTDMGGPHALIEAEESVSGMRAAIDRLEPGDSGGFFRYTGHQLAY